MKISKVQISEPKKNKPNFKESVAGCMTGGAVSLASAPIAAPIINKMSKIASTLSPTEIRDLNNASETILKTTGLKSLGVDIVDISNIKNNTGLPDKIAELIDPILGTSSGKNAFFTNKEIPNIIGANKIGINKQKLPTAAFHEIGHALNYNKSGFWRRMQKLRLPGMLIGTGLILFNVLTKKTKPMEGQELTKGQKIKNWIRDKSGFLAFGAMVPMLAEEAAASIKGCKLAKEALKNTPKLYKKVAKTNKVAYITYIASAAIAGLAAFSSAKIKDILVDKKEAKLKEKTFATCQA